MKVNVEKLEKNRVSMEIEVETEQVERALDQAYAKLVKKVNIPGFRKGKAPRSVLERFVGKPALMEEATDSLLSSNYMAAIDESGIEPIDRPDVEIVQYEEDKPFIFKVLVDVKPEVSLGEYKGLEIAKPDDAVSDEDVNKELENLQQRYAKLIELGEEDAIQDGDIAFISFEGSVDGVPFEGGASEGYSLGIGSGTFIPGFEEQLIGAKLNESRDVNVTFPENYQQENLAGKAALFKVGIKGIKRKEVAPLDDEFAKDVSEFETLEELKADTAKKLEERAKQRGEEEVRIQAIDKAAEKAEVEIPLVMIESRIMNMVEEFGQRLAMQGLSLDKYLEFANTDMEAIKEQYRPQAEQSVKTDLVLEAIAKAEGIVASAEEITGEIEKMAQQYDRDVESVRKAIEASGRLDSLSYSITINKTVDFLVDKSTLA